MLIANAVYSPTEVIGRQITNRPDEPGSARRCVLRRCVLRRRVVAPRMQHDAYREGRVSFGRLADKQTLDVYRDGLFAPSSSGWVLVPADVSAEVVVQQDRAESATWSAVGAP